MEDNFNNNGDTNLNNTNDNSDNFNESQQSNQNQEYQQYYQAPFPTQPGVYNMQQPKEGSNGFAIASLVLGIVGLFTCFCCGFSLLTGIMSIVFGAVSMQRRSSGNGMAIAGIILGAVSILCGIVIIAMFFFDASFYSNIDSYYKEFNSLSVYWRKH